MAVTLAEAAQLNPNELSQQVFRSLVMISDLLEIFPVIPKKGQGYTAFRDNATLPTIASRAINADYTENAGGDSVPKSFPFAIIGGHIDVDKALIEREGGPQQTVALRALKLRQKIDAMKYYVHNVVVNGDVGSVATDFNGFKALIADGNGNETALGTNGVNILASDTAMLDFMQTLDEIIGRVPNANAIICNATMKAIMTRIARKFGFYNTLVNEFGKISEMYGRCRLIDVGVKADGAEIITFTETQGSSSLASSLYICAVNEATGLTFASPQDIEADDMVIDHGLVPGGLKWRHTIDLQLTLAVQEKYSLHRVKGILKA